MRKRLVRTVCLIVLLGALGWLGLALARLLWATSRVQADLRSLERLAQTPINDIDIQGAAELLRATRVDVQALHAAARPFLWLAPHLGWLPRYGPDLRAAPALLDTALDLTAAGETLIEPLVSVAGEKPGLQGQALDRRLAALQVAHLQLQDALSRVRSAQTSRARVQPQGLSPELEGAVERLDRYLSLAERAIGGGLLLPELMGADGPRTWLLLVQNEDELRATGGFISAVARLTVEQGALLELDFEDSYAIDDFARTYPAPPEPLRTYMRSEQWVFRDSNWSPDFPTSAQAAIDLYAISRDAPIDGVIALDQHAIALFVEALGPLLVEGTSDPVTGANVIQMARRSWDPGLEVTGDWWVRRKDFMALVFEAVARRVESGLERGALVPLAKAVLRALDERHLLLWLKNVPSETQPAQESVLASTLLSDLGWDGSLVQHPGDYLMVVDANLGFNKANAVVEEQLTYVVDLSALDRPQATFTVRHRHLLSQARAPCRHEPRYDQTYEQMIERCYWDYLRVYVPPASRLIDATPLAISEAELIGGQPSPAQVRVGPPEQGRNVFATFLLVRPTETVETRFEYVLPGHVVQVSAREAVYTLHMQKQPGTSATPIHVQIVLPVGTQLGSSEPKPASYAGSVVEYDLTLLRDQMVRVILAGRFPERRGYR
jgi:hypothetical protein